MTLEKRYRFRIAVQERWGKLLGIREDISCSALEQWYSNVNGHQNYPKQIVKTQISGPRGDRIPVAESLQGFVDGFAGRGWLRCAGSTFGIRLTVGAVSLSLGTLGAPVEAGELCPCTHPVTVQETEPSWWLAHT